ncbi:hypothetical protein QUF90_00070 [Desulfococcaceae bacterium HSG9]|nr:hypothetical protein [Desulfococcaceae bacterium HSG9]
MKTCVLVKQTVILTVAGPILTAGSTYSGWGLDAVFYKDWQRNYALPGSLIRGKLREAMTNIMSVSPSDSFNVKQWFGEKSSDREGAAESYAPHRGILKLSDFIYKAEVSESADLIRTRIRIEPERLVVEKGALIISESPFASGGEFLWEGQVEFFVSEEDQAEYLSQLKKAFHFIPSIGADTTVGCGRLLSVQFKKMKNFRIPASNNGKNDQDAIGLDVSLELREPMLIGGVKRTETIFESEEIVPGAVLKGAMATGLNRLAGNMSLGQSIDERNEFVSAAFPHLAKFYTALRFLHAIPAEEPYIRKESIPLSVVCYGNEYENIAFKESEAEIWAKDTKPVSFRIDWKGNQPKIYKRPKLKYHPVMRTAIDEDLLKADDSKLYSFRMIKPAKEICWNFQVLFPENMPEDEKTGLDEEIHKALPLALRYIGKRQSRVDLSSKHIKPRKSLSRLNDALSFAITLRSSAIMVNPYYIAEKSEEVFDDHELMKSFYEGYWHDLFGNAVIMKRWFASQELQGGYIGMRFMKDHYRPFYLTSEGSTFVFIIQNHKSAEEKLKSLFREGLPLPSWAQKEYGGSLPWKRCPFVPQNGYGEIQISLKMKGDGNGTIL